MTKPIRILLAEDHTLVRAGLRTLLQQLPDVEVIAEATTGNEAVAIAKQLNPTLVVMDIAMPQLNGLEALARITRELPSTKVLILSMYIDEEHVRYALQHGAAGYLSKSASTTELTVAVRAIASGQRYLDTRVTAYVMNETGNYPVQDIGSSGVSSPEPDPLVDLTPRQREILQLIVEGHSTKDIARLLTVAIKTVEVHRTQLMKRLGIHNVAGLVRYAIRHGIIPRE